MKVNFLPNFIIPADNKALGAILFQETQNKQTKVGGVICFMQDDNLSRYFLLFFQLRSLSIKAAQVVSSARYCLPLSILHAGEYSKDNSCSSLVKICYKLSGGYLFHPAEGLS